MRTLGAIGLGLVLFAWWQTDSWRWAGSIAGAVGAAFGVVALMTWGVLKWARRFMRPSWPYAWRQGWSNLYRPQNQTWMILSVLGVSVFLSTTLVLMEDSLRREIAWESPEHQANVILFDLQPEQRAGMQHLLVELQVTVLHEVPIVTMRLATVKGRSVTEILRDPRHTEPDWILRREFRSSYRQDLRPTEKLTAGTWVGQQAGGGAGIPISVEEGLARDLKLQLGDVLTFDVQGVPMTTKVASLRQVDWRRFEPNFFVLFPTGVLEQAPAFYVSFIHTDNALVQAKLQRTIMEQYPNVSVLDLNLVLETVHRMLDQAGLAARGLMGLSVLTAVLVAWGALGLNSRQRQQESVLLRTLGASQTQLRHILWVEYASLGALGGMIGVGLASLAAWAFAHWGLKSELHLHFGNLVFAELLSIGLTMGLGGLWSRQVAQSPVLTWGARHR
jgi:putative ABC transport system permease protein